MNLDCLELQHMSVHPVRLLVACIEQAFSEENIPTLAEHDLVTEFGAIIMTEKDETPQMLFMSRHTGLATPIAALFSHSSNVGRYAGAFFELEGVALACAAAAETGFGAFSS